MANVEFKYSYSYVRLLPSEQIGVHQQDSWELSYVVVGKGVRLMGETQEAFASGDLVLVPPGVPHCWNFDSGCVDSEGYIENITLNFPTGLVERMVEIFPSLADAMRALLGRTEPVAFEGKRAERIVNKLVAMRDLSDSARVPLLVEVLLEISGRGSEHVAGIYRKPDKDRDRLSKVQIYVICNYNREITLDAVASHVGMNRTSFCSFFKRVTGTTFIDFLNNYRVEKACELLRGTELSVAEIAYNVGFTNVPYFNRVFKRRTGLTPTAFATSDPSRARK